MTTFALIGGGWRAQYFARVAQALPDHFRLTGTYLRTPEKRPAWAAQFGGNTPDSVEGLLPDKPDFLILCTRGDHAQQLIDLMALGVPILCETPPGGAAEDLARLYEAARQTGALVQVAEQYLDWPVHQAWLRAVREGLIGDVSNMSLSALHSYHAAGLIRRFLNVGFQDVAITGCQFHFPCMQTDAREAVILDGEVKPEVRQRLTLEFEGGKVAFFDFGYVQYHSFIRARHLNIQGCRGEIDDMTLRRMDPDTGLPLRQELTRFDLGVGDNNRLCHMGLQLGDRWLYRSPYLYARLNDEELAIAHQLERMGALARGDSQEPAYTLEDGLQDAYFAALMAQALDNPWHTGRSRRQPWAK